MRRSRVSCACCGQSWTVQSSLSEYEQQTLESRPCPHCGGYALCCKPVAEPVRHKVPRRLRAALATALRG